MTPKEALADAIMTFEGWRANSRSWRNRNPGNLRPFALTQAKDADGYRVFDSLAEGWQALLDDLQAKFNGSHRLTPQSTMLDLLNVYAPAGDANDPTDYTQFVCNWTTHILGRSINRETTLGQFLDGGEVDESTKA
jgi:hypothetical protein